MAKQLGVGTILKDFLSLLVGSVMLGTPNVAMFVRGKEALHRRREHVSIYCSGQKGSRRTVKKYLKLFKVCSEGFEGVSPLMLDNKGISTHCGEFVQKGRKQYCTLSC